jgi:hypothetical protein
MTDVAVAVRPIVRAESKSFYFYMALVCMAIAYLGFLPSYWAPMANGTLEAAPIVHAHGAIFFVWSLYFVFQSWLGATGRVVRHRDVGLIGVSLVTAMVIFGVLISIHVLRETAAAGRPDVGINVAVASLTNILLFAVLAGAALATTWRSDWHKRLMLMAAISILGAPIARWFIYYLHAPRPPKGPDWIVVLLALVPMVHDWRSRGRPHVAYWIAIAAIVAVRLVRGPFGATPTWHVMATWLAGLAG